MKIYIDFDGVILDTDKIIDEEIPKDTNISRRDFIKNYDWNILLEKSEQINNSFYYLKQAKYDIFLLSKFASMEEGEAKVKFLRKKGVNINIHLVPVDVEKSSVVNAHNNILIDDKIYNLDDWKEKGGIPIFFNKENLDTDIKGKINTKYFKISNLDLLLSDKLIEIIKELKNN